MGAERAGRCRAQMRERSGAEVSVVSNSIDPQRPPTPPSCVPAEHARGLSPRGLACGARALVAREKFIDNERASDLSADRAHGLSPRLGPRGLACGERARVCERDLLGIIHNGGSKLRWKPLGVSRRARGGRVSHRVRREAAGQPNCALRSAFQRPSRSCIMQH